MVISYISRGFLFLLGAHFCIYAKMFVAYCCRTTVCHTNPHHKPLPPIHPSTIENTPASTYPSKPNSNLEARFQTSSSSYPFLVCFSSFLLLYMVVPLKVLWTDYYPFSTLATIATTPPITGTCKFMNIYTLLRLSILKLIIRVWPYATLAI